MQTIFLDNNIWNCLVKHDRYTASQRAKARNRLIEGVQNKEWRVVCCISLLQETIRTYRIHPEKYEEMRSLIFNVVDTGWLIDLDFRYIAELHNKGLLSITDRYFNREKRKQVKSLSTKKKILLEVDDIAYSEALNFKVIHEDIRRDIYKRFGSLNGKPPKSMVQEYDDWFNNKRNPEEWVLGIVQSVAAKGKISAKIATELEPSYDNCPSLWQFINFTHAKIKLNIGDHKKIKDSDKVDADIYSCSPYYDVLYTEDGDLKRQLI